MRAATDQSALSVHVITRATAFWMRCSWRMFSLYLCSTLYSKTELCSNGRSNGLNDSWPPMLVVVGHIAINGKEPSNLCFDQNGSEMNHSGQNNGAVEWTQLCVVCALSVKQWAWCSDPIRTKSHSNRLRSFIRASMQCRKDQNRMKVDELNVSWSVWPSFWRKLLVIFPNVALWGLTL